MVFVYVPGLPKNISTQAGIKRGVKGKTHLSPSQPPVFVDWAVDPPRDTAEPPEVGDDRERDNEEEDILGTLREAPSGEDEVVEQVRGHQDGKVERRELSCR
jgi:hypothetical protein